MSEKTNVFLSWSGNISRQIAEKLKEVLEIFSDELEVFFSPDIEAGIRWSNEISQKLQGIDIGIFVYTKDNLDSLWMAFEAGAISKKIEEARVISFIFGDDIRAKDPLSQFQSKRFSEKGLQEILESVNSHLINKKEGKKLKAYHKLAWPSFSESVYEILAQDQQTESLQINESNSTKFMAEMIDTLQDLINKIPVYETNFAKDISKFLEQVKTTSRGNYLFIDGERSAFAALIAATMRAKKIIRSTRFSPMPISGHYDDYNAAIFSRVIPNYDSTNCDCVDRYIRIVSANDEAKLKDIDMYLEKFLGCKFDLYLTNKTNSFELVIIDEEELFIHFYAQEHVIDSTLHIVGSEVTKNFIDIYQQLHDPKYNPGILKIEFEYIGSTDMADDWREKIKNYFNQNNPNVAENPRKGVIKKNQ